MAKKKTDIPKEFAISVLGGSFPRGQVGKQWVFQGTTPEFRNVPNSGVDDVMIREYVIPTDPKTPAQLRQRELWKERVDEWNALPQSEKDYWKAEAKRLRKWSAFAYFMSKRQTQRQGKGKAGSRRVVRGRGRRESPPPITAIQVVGKRTAYGSVAFADYTRKIRTLR